MSIVLRPIAVTGLNIRFARDMGDNKIRHYVIPASLSLIRKFTGQTNQDILREFIKKTENEEVEFLETEEVVDFSHLFDIENFEVRQAGSFVVTDVSKIVLSRDKDIGRSLRKVDSKHQLHQWNYYPTIFHRYYDRFAYFYNKSFVPMANKFLYKLQGADYSNHNHFVKQLTFLKPTYQRRIEPVHYLAIGFESEDAIHALDAMRKDLRILQKNKLIMGNLAMPSIMQLADTVGIGRYYALFCFPIIDHTRLIKIAGLTGPSGLPNRDQLSLVGVKYENYEGSVKWLNDIEPNRKFEIEEINVQDVSEEERRQMVVDSYQESRDHVNAIAKDMKDTLSEMEKVSSNSYDVINTDFRGGNGVSVNVAMQHKDNALKINGSSANKEINGKSIKE